MRRTLLALTVSLAVHVLAVAIPAGFGLWSTLSLVPAVKVQPISVDLKDLPLGAPPARASEDKAPSAARKPPRRHRVAAAHDGVKVPARPDAGAPENKPDAAPSTGAYDGGGVIDGGRRRPGDLRENGPEGSRLIALLRLDRLRASPDSAKTIAAIDQLLLLLPDRHRLIDGTGLDLYRDFDCLLVATPNPADASVTFLAVRHHLSDPALRAALARGAKAAHKPIEWKTFGGRPVGLRSQPTGGPTAPWDRDDRIIALPRPALAIMATPAYATLLLDIDPTQSQAGRIDAGVSDLGATNRARRKSVSRARWQTIAERIDAEEAALPDDATFMMMATGLFAPVTSTTGYVVPPTRGASDDQPLQPVNAESGAPPQTLTLVIGIESPYIEVSADFTSESDADRWERELPVWRRKLLTNPVVFLGGFASLIGRAESSREENTLRLRAETTVEELQRLLTLAANLTRAAQIHRRQ